MLKILSFIKTSFLILLFLPLSVQANTITDMKWCVFDPVGANGPSKTPVDDYKIAALRWQVRLSAHYYTDDQEAMKAYEAGECDMVTLPDFRARKFNHFTGSLSAVGAIPSYKHMGTILKSLSVPKAEKLMTSDDGQHEIIGIALVGGVHTFMKNRKWVTPEQLEGKKVSILSGIEETAYFSEKTKTVPIESDLGTMFSNFNNGVSDMTIAPLIVYEGLELAKGLGEKGGISRYPIAMITMQHIARKSALPEGAGTKSREFMAGYHAEMVKTVRSYEEVVPESYYFDVPLTTIYYADDLFSGARKDLAEKGIYNTKMLTLLKKVRCKDYPDRAECNSDAL